MVACNLSPVYILINDRAAALTHYKNNYNWEKLFVETIRAARQTELQIRTPTCITDNLSVASMLQLELTSLRLNVSIFYIAPDIIKPKEMHVFLVAISNFP